MPKKTSVTGSAHALAFLLGLAGLARAADHHVAPNGNDSGPGTAAQPWKTMQKAADSVGPGDVVTVHPGHYVGFNLFTSGTPAAPIVFRAVDSELGPNPGVVVDQNNAFTKKDRINLEGASHVVVEGFTVLGTGDPATSRACIRAVGFPSAMASFVTFRRNRCDLGGRWGILTGHVNDLTVEDNETSRSAAEHGIYASNSGDRPVIRRNRIWGNHSNGIHLNGDLALGGDGNISDALIERNVIWENGKGNPLFGPPGGSGINCDGVRDSTIRNNLLYANHASGISLYRIDAALPSQGNLVVHNTVHMASDGRWALNIQDGSSGNVVFNNVLLNDHPTRGSIDLAADCLPGFVSDSNVVKDKFSFDDTFLTFAQWKAQTGQDQASTVATPAQTFALPAYEPKPGSPAVDSGAAAFGAEDDLLGKPRPFGAGFDRGCYELGSCIGSIAYSGTGLAGTGGVVPTVAAGGCPDAGDVLSLAIGAPLAGAPGLLLIGTAPLAAPFYGGTLLVAPTIVLPLAGSVTVDVAVPLSAGPAGIVVRLQAAFADPGAPLDVALSAALVLELG